MGVRRGRLVGERGQVVPLVALVVLVAVLGVAGVGRLGAVAHDRARARSAADAAALAGVVEGRDGAEDLARGNGGEVVAFTATGGEVEVTVRVGGAQATARARHGG